LKAGEHVMLTKVRAFSFFVPYSTTPDIGFRWVTGSKSSVHTHLNYLVIVSPPFIPSASSASATVRNFARMTDLPAGSDITKVTVFDLENKLVAYSGTFEAGVREVVSQWGRIFVLESDGRVCFRFLL
jgi:hypothetical protein